MQDILLQKFFESQRWENAIYTGAGKELDTKVIASLTTPLVRLAMKQRICDDAYEIAPPHQQEIPKDDGSMRIVYINEDIDRVFLGIANDLFFEVFSEFVHPNCRSYQKGLGTGKTVKDVSRQATKLTNQMSTDTIGIKADLSKYFDSVPLQYIDMIFDMMESICGPSKIIDVIRKYYHCDLCFDTHGELMSHYQSLKQGCAVASFLADAVLYHMDEQISNLPNIYYIRYSDDILALGPAWEDAYKMLSDNITSMDMVLNPKKVEPISKQKWFKFLGFNIMGNKITLSQKRVKTFQSEIQSRIKNTPEQTMKSIYSFLYKGNGEFSWATSVLPVINVVPDINTLDNYVKDAIRASYTHKTKIGGLGSDIHHKDYTILRGRGKNVRFNLNNTPKELDGYYTIKCMQNAITTNKSAYEAIVRTM